MNFIPPQDETRLRAAASGVLPNGKPVVVNADGTVSVVSGADQAIGSEVVFENATVSAKSSTFDSNSNKVVIAYQDAGNSNYGTAVVGTVNGTSISFGSVVVFESAGVNYVSCTFDSNSNKVVISYTDDGNSSYGTAIVGTVSGTNISFGTAAVFRSAAAGSTNATFDSNSNKVVICYAGDSDHGTAIVGTVSGTNISFGTAVVFESANSVLSVAAFDSNSNKVVIAYSDYPNGQYGTAIVGTVSGTNISFGTTVVFESASIGTIGHTITFDSNSNKVVIAYQDIGNSSYGTAIVGTVSGTGISFGTAVVFENATSTYPAATFDSNSNKVVIAYRDGGNTNKGTVIAGAVSGTSISFESPIVFESGASLWITTVFDSNSNTSVISYRDAGNSSYGTSIVFQTASTNITAENYVGMSGGGVEYDVTAEALGSETVFGNNPGGPSYPYMGMAFDLNANRVVIAYRDSGNDSKGTVVVGAISGTSISFGTPVVLLDTGSGGQADFLNVVYDSNSNKVVISFSAYIAASGSSGRACVGTVNPADNSISIGTLATFTSGNSSTTDASATFDSNLNKVVIAYGNSANSGYGTSVVGTVSGTNISFGTVVVFESASVTNISSAFDSNSNKVVIAYRDTGNSDYGTSIVGTVSGTGISFGTAVVFNSGRADKNAVVFDSNSNKIVIAFMDGGDNEKGKAVVGTVSGTGISYGSEVTYSASGSRVDWVSAVYNSTAQKVIISYRRYIDSSAAQSGELISGTVSGTSISFGTATQFNNAGSNYNGSAYDSTSSTVVTAYSDAGNSNKNTAIVYQAGFDNTVRGQVASGSSASVDIIGTVSTNQDGLTPGQSYFVQTDGTLGLTADDPSVFAGTAISATKLLVKA